MGKLRVTRRAKRAGDPAAAVGARHDRRAEALRASAAPRGTQRRRAVTLTSGLPTFGGATALAVRASGGTVRA
jgi:hypothetical protein